MTLRSEVGVMQGRLSAAVGGPIQSFPWTTWESEFELAQIVGLSLIEWIVEADRFDENPIMSEATWMRVRDLQDRSGVSVRTVCADCFMTWPLGTKDRTLRSTSIRALSRLVERCAEAGVGTITIPFVDRSALSDEHDCARAIAALQGALAAADSCGVDLALEMSLPPGGLRAFLNELDHPRVRVTYDMGNSASLGFDPAEEFAAYGPAIANVHVKDRVHGGSTVALGTGHVSFGSVFALLDVVRYAGPLILQGARIDAPVRTIRHYLTFLQPYLNADPVAS